MIDTQESLVIERYINCLVGTPYKLGGNVPQDGGMDCSAVVLELLRCISKWGTSDATAQMIYNTLAKKNDDEKPPMTSHFIMKDSLLFFGESTSKITHVAWAIGAGFMFEAGGNDKTGMCRFRKITWRKDLVAVVAL